MRDSVIWVRFLGAALMAGCGGAHGTNQQTCAPGASAGCTCADGITGARVCQPDGTYDQCVCGSGLVDGGPTDAQQTADTDLVADSGTGDGGAAEDGAVDGGGVAQDGAQNDGEACAPLLSDFSFASAPSNEWTSVDIKPYFPKPAAGTVRINMYGVMSCESLYFTNAESISAPDASGNQAIHDYTLNSTGTDVVAMVDTWCIRNDSTGVKEFHDYFYNPSGDYAIESHPFDHGNIIAKGGGNPNVYSSAYGLQQPSGTYQTVDYSIWLQDIKTSVTTPAGTFTNFTMQAELQHNAAWDTRYRWYWAPGIGFIAMTSLDANWNPVYTMYLLKTCLAASTVWVCP